MMLSAMICLSTVAIIISIMECTGKMK
jgi:hypothetical protein